MHTIRLQDNGRTGRETALKPNWEKAQYTQYIHNKAH